MNWKNRIITRKIPLYLFISGCILAPDIHIGATLIDLSILAFFLLGFMFARVIYKREKE